MQPARNSDVYSLSLMCQQKVLALVDEAKTELSNLVIFEGRRSPERQAYYYGMGRNKPQMMWTYPTKPGYWQYANPSAPKRTRTTKSFHLTGDAADFCFDYGDGYTWEGNWKKLRELGKKHKLQSLYPYESAHLQHNPKYDLTLKLMGDSETLAKELWAEADKIAKEGERLIDKSAEIKNRAHAIAEAARNN